MKLTTKIKLTSEYRGKSKFDFFTSLLPGDILTIVHELKSVRNFDNGNFATTIQLVKEDTAESFTTTLGMFLKYLDQMSFEEVK